jgi:hypothetical protein
MFCDGTFRALGCLVMGPLVMGHCVMGHFVMGRIVMGRFVCESNFASLFQLYAYSSIYSKPRALYCIVKICMQVAAIKTKSREAIYKVKLHFFKNQNFYRGDIKKIKMLADLSFYLKYNSLYIISQTFFERMSL